MVSKIFGNVNSFMRKLCLMEKFQIAKHFNNINFLNKKLELIN